MKNPCLNCIHIKYEEKDMITARLLPTHRFYVKCEIQDNKDYTGSNITYKQFSTHGPCYKYSPITDN